jgi:uncharacterized protein YuzE
MPPFDSVEHVLRYYRVLGKMKPIFANPTPIDYSYDPAGDALYLTFARQKAERTYELLADWPIVTVDVNDEGQIVGVEYVGVKQFGIETFMRLLQERLRRAGIEIAEQEAESFMSFMRSREAELALSS